jgi:hypothetical protein
MKMHALIALYNDYSSLSMCIHSIKNYVDDIIIADGAYKLYYDEYKKAVPDAKPWSTDGGIEIAKAIPNLNLKIIEPIDHKPWENQCTKRTALLDAVPEGDGFIVLDADEMVYGEPARALTQIFSSGCLAGNMPMYTPGLDAGHFWPYWHPRVFLKLKGMHYSRKHWNLRDGDGRVIETTYPVKWTDQMVLVHLKVFRGKERLMPHLGYMHMMSLDGWMEPMKMPQMFNLNEM